MTWALINADKSWAAGPFDDQPEVGPGQRVIPVALGYPDTCLWSPAADGFVDIVIASPLISVGRFKLLFTQAERLQLHAAASQNAEVYDFLDLLGGFTEGVSLSDPVLIASVDHLAQAGLLTADRAVAILAGQTPA